MEKDKFVLVFEKRILSLNHEKDVLLRGDEVAGGIKVCFANGLLCWSVATEFRKKRKHTLVFLYYLADL